MGKQSEDVKIVKSNNQTQPREERETTQDTKVGERKHKDMHFSSMKAGGYGVLYCISLIVMLYFSDFNVVYLRF